MDRRARRQGEAEMTGLPDEDPRVRACRALAGISEAIQDCFGEGFDATPRLDMLAQLFLAEREQRELHAWSLCLASRVPASTAHRKIGELERRGLVACHRGASAETDSGKSGQHRDHRYVRVSLTLEGRDTIAALLDQLAAIWSAPGAADGIGPLS